MTTTATTPPAHPPAAGSTFAYGVIALSKAARALLHRHVLSASVSTGHAGAAVTVHVYEPADAAGAAADLGLTEAEHVRVGRTWHLYWTGHRDEARFQVTAVHQGREFPAHLGLTEPTGDPS